MSTTTNKETAVDYSGVRDQRGTLLEIEVGRVDVGASIRFLSQYPDEEEFLMQPLACLEVRPLAPLDFLFVAVSSDRDIPLTPRPSHPSILPVFDAGQRQAAHRPHRLRRGPFRVITHTLHTFPKVVPRSVAAGQGEARFTTVVGSD
jgi:hypothetical protein